MESEGRQGDEGREGSAPPSNVVQFPRDWFGPKEELVPFGPRASRADVDDADVTAPAGADDFWGEGSAAVHDVLRGPDPVERVGVVSAPPTRVRRWRIASLSGAARVAYARARDWMWGVLRLRFGGRSVLAGGLAVVACVVAVVGTIEGAPGGAGARGGERARLAVAGTAGFAGVSDSGDSSWRRAALFMFTHRPSTPARPIVRRRVHVLAARSVGSAATVSPPPVTPAPTYVSSPASASSTPVARAASASAAESSASESSASGGASVASGPVGPGAPFGPGHLG